MSLPISPEVAKAMLMQARLEQTAKIYAAREAERAAMEQIKNIDAQLGGIEMTLQIQARAAEAQAVAEDQLAPDINQAPRDQ